MLGKIAQIGTGQGKSVVLAGLSCYLALCGFEVNCACYSLYLSTRDREDFAELFNTLKVSNKIIYGTFDQICASLLNRTDADGNTFKDQTKNILSLPQQSWTDKFLKLISSFQLFSNLESSDQNKNQNRKILLIDQVDVFFDSSFFGSLYSPVVSFDTP